VVNFWLNHGFWWMSERFLEEKRGERWEILHQWRWKMGNSSVNVEVSSAMFDYWRVLIWYIYIRYMWNLWISRILSYLILLYDVCSGYIWETLDDYCDLLLMWWGLYIYICMYAYMFGKIESVAKKNTGYPRLSICRVFVLILDHGERYAVFFPLLVCYHLWCPRK
jgi:hypothetical protein